MSTAQPFPYRRRLALALDIDDLVEAVDLAPPCRRGSAWPRSAWSCSRPRAGRHRRPAGPGLEVFVDLKLHDIPTTVHKAARVLGAVGARYVTLHAQGGRRCCRPASRASGRGGGRRPRPPMALAVTVLTSDNEAPPHIVPQRVRMAVEAGCVEG